MFVLWLSIALAADEVHAVPDGKTELVTGPAVWMSEPRFTRMLIAEKNLPLCEDALEESSKAGLEATRRATEAFELARVQFSRDEESLDEAQRLIWSQAEQLRLERERSARLREQRNVAWGIAGGFLAASTAAIVLAVQ